MKIPLIIAAVVLMVGASLAVAQEPVAVITTSCSGSTKVQMLTARTPVRTLLRARPVRSLLGRVLFRPACGG